MEWCLFNTTINIRSSSYGRVYVKKKKAKTIWKIIEAAIDKTNTFF